MRVGRLIYMRLNGRTIILLIAAFIASLTAVVVRNRLASLSHGAHTEQAASKRILVAKRDVPPGKFVDSTTDLEWAAPVDETETNVIREAVSKKSDFNGGVVRRALKVGMPVAPDAITKAGDGGFLSAVLEPGTRAVAIAVTATTSAAGFIAPGDRVDLIVTHRIKSARSDGNEQETVLSETFVRDVRVVAVDQSLDTDNKAQLAKNVTVEVTEAQAEQIAVANEMGKISLALRSALAADKTAEGEKNATRGSDIIPLLTQRTSVAPRVQIIRGDNKEELQFLGR